MDYKEQIELLHNLEAIAYGYNINGEVFGIDCSDFEQIMVDAARSIEELLSRAEAAEARAENAARKLDAAMLELDEVSAAVDNLDEFIDEQIYPLVSYDMYTALRDNADYISIWRHEVKWRGKKEE